MANKALVGATLLMLSPGKTPLPFRLRHTHISLLKKMMLPSSAGLPPDLLVHCDFTLNFYGARVTDKPLRMV